MTDDRNVDVKPKIIQMFRVGGKNAEYSVQAVVKYCYDIFKSDHYHYDQLQVTVKRDLLKMVKEHMLVKTSGGPNSLVGKFKWIGSSFGDQSSDDDADGDDADGDDADGDDDDDRPGPSGRGAKKSGGTKSGGTKSGGPKGGAKKSGGPKGGGPKGGGPKSGAKKYPLRSADKK